jgi:hypothetical protein
VTAGTATTPAGAVTTGPATTPAGAVTTGAATAEASEGGQRKEAA